VIRRRARLYDYVRQATQLDAKRAAALGDPIARTVLFEEIMHMDIPDRPAAQPPAWPRRRRLVAITAALAIVVAATITAGSLLGWWPAPHTTVVTHDAAPAQTQGDQPQGDVFAGGSVGSCVEEYNPQNLARRGFAVDATVVSIGTSSPSGDVGGDPFVPVVLQVNHWYRGGSAVQITVGMLPPLVKSTVGNTTYQVGSRLLVSGEDRNGDTKFTDPLAWSCGFTRWYGDADAQIWAQAFR
jgi:hypothetical protein